MRRQVIEFRVDRRRTAPLGRKHFAGAADGRLESVDQCSILAALFKERQNLFARFRAHSKRKMSLSARLQSAQQATAAAEEKIQTLIDLVKKAREEEETVRSIQFARTAVCLLVVRVHSLTREFARARSQRVPYELRQRYQRARMRKKKAVDEIAQIKASREAANSPTPVQWKPVKQVRAPVFLLTAVSRARRRLSKRLESRVRSMSDARNCSPKRA